MGPNGGKGALSLASSAKDYFRQSLQEALIERKIEIYPVVEAYLVDLLEHYVITEHLFDEQRESGKKTRETLAELLLKAGGAPPRARFDMLKKLGDSSLYISGFFGDSLQRKIVDIDYYIDMGSTAYISLSHEISEDSFAHLYKEIAHRFNEFVDVFTVMSRKAMPKDGGDNVLRLMDVYVKTGSGLAQDKLTEKGIFPNAQNTKTCKNQ